MNTPRYYVESKKFLTRFFTVDQVAKACIYALRTDGTVYRECEDGITRRYEGKYWIKAQEMKAAGRL